MGCSAQILTYIADDSHYTPACQNMTYGCKCIVHFRGMLCVALRLLSRLVVWAVYNLPNLWRSWNAKSTSCQTASLCLTVGVLIISYPERSCVHLRGMCDGHDQFRCQITCFSSLSRQPTDFGNKYEAYPVVQVQGHHLSLIHIWRCRRIERCRSRWSPYH